jgi:hypothetical protein
MEKKVCRQCNKALPPESTSDLCCLCAVGLVPPKRVYGEGQAEHMVVEGRILSGINCPACGGEFTRADLSRRSCSVCGAFYTTERLRELSQKASSEPLKTEPQSQKTMNTATQDDKRWPDDVPLW